MCEWVNIITNIIIIYITNKTGQTLKQIYFRRHTALAKFLRLYLRKYVESCSNICAIITQKMQCIYIGATIIYCVFGMK